MCCMIFYAIQDNKDLHARLPHWLSWKRIFRLCVLATVSKGFKTTRRLFVPCSSPLFHPVSFHFLSALSNKAMKSA